jgi:hypothetical protein
MDGKPAIVSDDADAAWRFLLFIGTDKLGLTSLF